MPTTDSPSTRTIVSASGARLFVGMTDVEIDARLAGCPEILARSNAAAKRAAEAMR